MKRCISLIAILIALSLSAACWFKVSTHRYDEERVDSYAATDHFVSLFNDRKFEEIYEMTHERAKATKSKTALINMLSSLREGRGKIVDLERADSSATPGDGLIEVTLQFKVNFERGENHLTLVWYVANRSAKLFSLALE
ncbi:MAG TPA: hypothetical protein VMZ26_04660 [Pyrinomonadaceae bacterium]|nr:hypothetical protein [Pyrinomonadaceae bacterium]